MRHEAYYVLSQRKTEICFDRLRTRREVVDDDYTDSGEPLALTDEATLTVCDLTDVGWPYDPTHQHDLVALHKWHGYEEGGEGYVEALPLAGFCETGARAESTDIMRYAKAGWGLVRDYLLSAVVPAPLHANPPVALHRGMGGTTTDFSRFQLALPAKMTIESGNNQIALVDAAVADDLVVHVTDLKGHDVAGARVWFSPTQDPVGALPGGRLDPPGEFNTLTGSDGRAKLPPALGDPVSWVLGPVAGNYYLNASGRGIAVDGLDGPRSEFDPYAPLQQHWLDDLDGGAVQLGEDGAVTFTATACEAVYDVSSVLGGLVDPEAEIFPFEASISGGPAAPAEVSIWNDCINLYINLTVERDGGEKVNSLRIDLDDGGDGRTEGDDIVIVDFGVDGTATLNDMWLTQSCVSRKQAGCGAADTTADDKQATFDIDHTDGVNWVYVIVIPLRNPEDLEHDLNVALGDDVGVSITLQMGNGAQGNTQVPGFAVYEYLRINP